MEDCLLNENQINVISVDTCLAHIATICNNKIVLLSNLSTPEEWIPLPKNLVKKISIPILKSDYFKLTSWLET